MPTVEELQDVLAQSRGVNLAGVVLPQDGYAIREIAALERLTAVQYWVRLVRAVDAERLAAHAAEDKAAWERIAHHLASVEIDCALETALRPDVTSWVWSTQMGNGGGGEHVPGRLQLFGHLAGDLGVRRNRLSRSPPSRCFTAVEGAPRAVSRRVPISTGPTASESWLIHSRRSTGLLALSRESRKWRGCSCFVRATCLPA